MVGGRPAAGGPAVGGRASGGRASGAPAARIPTVEVPKEKRSMAVSGYRSTGRRRGAPRIALVLAAASATLMGCGLLGGGDDGSSNGPVQAGVLNQPGAPATTAPAAPSVPPGGAQRAPTGEPVTLEFAGDVHFAGSSAAGLTSLGPIIQTLTAADLTVLNLETAITTGGEPASKAFTFRAPPQAFTSLRAAGVDVVNVANNHGMDYGPTGLQDTLRAAQAAKFPVVGIGQDDVEAFQPYRTEIKGQRIAVIGATRVLDDELAAAWTAGPGKPGLASAKDLPKLLAAVRAARADSDTVVVFLHWGVEMRSCAGEDQTGIVPALVDAGADIVVGSHAHVLEGGGWHPSGAFVDYGLGNFVFYASGVSATTQSGVLRLTVQGRAVTQAEWVPARIVNGLPRLATGSDAQAILAAKGGLQGCAGLNPNPPTWGAIPVTPQGGGAATGGAATGEAAAAATPTG
ncbi:poly-gamma-glutamate biosynthesis protein [Pseudofrankia sp. EUN1h]|nr:poly-gamma-glutamate biosynthesis protein [Pseudofrankia sp. EUN1h]